MSDQPDQHKPDPAPAEANTGQHPVSIDVPTRRITYSRRRVRTGLSLTLAGFLVFLMGASPDAFV